ncbi:hypothetical protein [Azospirillum argentinense]|uniref:hypothetical protein n=1 Tax=Azospirillum TaxID=191 RepID=UPI0019669D5B|nr:hypothetical protein [Azospirillum brasilense]
MPINSERELEQAVAEFQRLADEPAGSSGERRKLELDADIKAFYAQHSDDMRKGKPRHE